MAKGQMRSNREARKPKQEKQPAKVEGAFGNLVTAAKGSTPQGSGQKK